MAAIIANPDDDTPRLVYADWLDEHLPDRTPSPAAGPSARAEYIRVQCRLAQFPFDAPEYPELLEREQDLAEWLQTHADEPEPDLPAELLWFGSFDSGETATYRRGFPDEVEYTEYADDPNVNVERILKALPQVFARTTLRALRLEDAYGEEIAELLRSPAIAGLRGLALYDIADDNDQDVTSAIAASPHLSQLKRLELELYVTSDELQNISSQAGLDACSKPCTSIIRKYGVCKYWGRAGGFAISVRFTSRIPVNATCSRRLPRSRRCRNWSNW